jgi:hypothetical protein
MVLPLCAIVTQELGPPQSQNFKILNKFKLVLVEVRQAYAIVQRMGDAREPQ